jgi:mannose-1-phosphate guanylyltransferase
MDLSARRSPAGAFDKNRILTVLNRAHERHCGDLVNEIMPENLVIQPANRGTALAILYALLRLSEVARAAYVAVFQSDDLVSDDLEFLRRVDLAFDAIESQSEMTVLLGITPHAAGVRIWLYRARRVGGRSLSIVPPAPVWGKTC